MSLKWSDLTHNTKTIVFQITNQTLSQSVPAGVIVTINGFAKVFIGTLIERAREIQKQYMEADEILSAMRSQKEGQFSVLTENYTRDDYPFSIQTHSSRGLIDQALEQHKHVGPLLPDHLREAFRRYKRDGEGGGAALGGISLGFGLAGTGSARLQGKRLFR